MTWREFVYAALGTVVPAAQVHSGGSLVAPPAVRPFVVYRVQARDSVLRDGGVPVRTNTWLEVWYYSEPGDYTVIDQLVIDGRNALQGQVAAPDKVCCEWQGDSGELADDEMKAIMRFSTFKLVGGDSV